MLEKKFKLLCSHYNNDNQLINQLWLELKKHYTDRQRYYHNLTHLEHLYNELEALVFPQEIWHQLQYALFYHDIIYDIKKSDNEKQSAIMAESKLSLLKIPTQSINRIMQLINETKTLQASSESNAFFLDADLAILGTSHSEYLKYRVKIRKEYLFYNKETYAKGRKKVLKKFLNKKNIFHTPYFYNQYEEQAQSNLLAEYHQL